MQWPLIGILSVNSYLRLVDMFFYWFKGIMGFAIATELKLHFFNKTLELLKHAVTFRK